LHVTRKYKAEEEGDPERKIGKESENTPKKTTNNERGGEWMGREKGGGKKKFKTRYARIIQKKGSRKERQEILLAWGDAGEKGKKKG